MRKLVRVKPWIVREVEKPLSEGEYRQTPEELDEYKQFSMCINCMLCYAACPIYGLDPKFIGPGGDRARAALQPRQPRPGRVGADGGALGARRDLGLHVRRRVHEGVPEARRSGRRDPALQADRGARVDEVVLHAEGGVMERRSARLHAVSPALAAAAASPPTGGCEKRSYFAFILRESSCMFVAWFVVYLLLLVQRGRPGAADSYAGVPRVVGDALGAGAERRQLRCFVVFHAITFFDGRAAGDGGAHRAHAACPAAWSWRATTSAWAVVSAVVAWLLAGGLSDQATSRTVAVAALQRRRRAVGDADADPAAAVRRRVSAGLDARRPATSRCCASLANPLTRLVLFALVRAVAVPLGASLPAHAVRRAADQAPQRGDRAPVLRCRGGRIGSDRVYLLWQIS